VQATWGLIAFQKIPTLAVNLPSVEKPNLRGDTSADGGGKIPMNPQKTATRAVMRLFKAVTDTHS